MEEYKNNAIKLVSSKELKHSKYNFVTKNLVLNVSYFKCQK